MPPRPGHRPPAQSRTPGAPAETPSETTARLRPVPPAPQPGSDTERGATPAAAQNRPGTTAVPPRPQTRPDTGTRTDFFRRPASTTVPSPPQDRPRVPSADVFGGPASGAVPPRPDSRPGVPSGTVPPTAVAPAVPPATAFGGSGDVPPKRAEAAVGFGAVAPGRAGEAEPEAWTPLTPPAAFAMPAQSAPPGAAGIPPHSAGTPAAPASVTPDPALSWTAMTPPADRPVVTFGEPEGYDGQARPGPLAGRLRSRTTAAAVCVVLGFGLIGGAATGSWLTGGSGEDGAPDTFAAAAELWHSIPVDQLFPPTVQGTGAGPGGADRTWTRIAVAPDGGCQNAFDPLLHKVLAPAGCRRLLRATYTDATRSYVTTVGLLFTKADAATMSALAARFRKEGLDRRADLMPRPYAAKDTVAAAFGDKQRASWTVSVLTDTPVVVFAVSGWADGRSIDTPQPAADATQSGATTAPAQAGLGNEAQGLADRIERAFRKTADAATEEPS
ncbi:hypothetical protein [Streptomyces sp. NPDC002265]|uniref:hypothetical protein n=1 Tax=Streptomyces sp. NPDC002265 TaxID=3154415 RepID=UPI00331D175A